MGLTVLIAAFAVPSTIFPQTTLKPKALTGCTMNVWHAVNYYLHKKIPSPGFSVQYNSVFSGLQIYKERDSAIAYFPVYQNPKIKKPFHKGFNSFKSCINTINV